MHEQHEFGQTVFSNRKLFHILHIYSKLIYLWQNKFNFNILSIFELNVALVILSKTCARTSMYRNDIKCMFNALKYRICGNKSSSSVIVIIIAMTLQTTFTRRTDGRCVMQPLLQANAAHTNWVGGASPAKSQALRPSLAGAEQTRRLSLSFECLAAINSISFCCSQLSVKCSFVVIAVLFVRSTVLHRLSVDVAYMSVCMSSK